MTKASFAEQDNQSYDKPESFIISHYNHPAMQPFKSLLKDVYASIGIDVGFVELPISRGYTELDAGKVDADVLRVKNNAQKYQNITLVYPPLYRGELLLICPLTLPCELSVLKSKDTVVTSNAHIQKMIGNLGMKAFVLTNETNDITALLGMLKKGRVDYVLFGSTQGLRESLSQDFNVLVIAESDLHHVISNKHLPLLPELEKALSEHMQTFSPDSINFQF